MVSDDAQRDGHGESLPTSGLVRTPGDGRVVPWRRTRSELVLILLVAAAALTPVYAVSSQDSSRLCLSRSILSVHLTIGSCAGGEVDRARYQGRTYSDKAPGMSLLAVPWAAALSLPPASRWSVRRDPRVWLIRLLTGGAAVVVLALVVARVGEGLAPGLGGLVLVTFALATLAGSMAATTFGHVTAAALGFTGFLSAWRGRYAAAGMLAGAAVIFEYQAAIIALAVAGYVAFRGLRPLGGYLAATVPSALVLAAYDRAAFGSPFHLSYRYVSNRFAREQATGLFGIGFPRWHSVGQVLVGDRGLLVVSPVLVLALVGLVLLTRLHRAEALVCLAIVAGFLLVEFGYFLPYGGTSPGPRFFIPALPFLALGLAPAFARFRRTTVLLAIPSLVASVTLQLTWAWSGNLAYRDTVWGELWRTVARGDRRLRLELASNALTWVGASLTEAALFVGLSAAAAFAVALLVAGGEPAG